MDSQHVALAICATAAAYFLFKRRYSSSISDVPGPKNPSWVYGHPWWWQREDAAVVEKSILEEYGTIARWNACLGEQRLWVADPKAIHHILQGSSSLYEIPSITSELISALTDRGIAAVVGDVHKRQRRAMAPAFGLVEAKSLYSYFNQCANSLADKWHDIISEAESGQGTIINVQPWLDKATLDAIGAGAFDYDFGALENADNKLTKSYRNLFSNLFNVPTKEQMFVLDALKFVPDGFVTWILKMDKLPWMEKLRENRTCVHEVAAKLIEDKRQELKDGTSRRDILSVLVKANSSLRPDWRLKDEELIAQVRTVMFGGHETVARTLTLALWELAKNRRVQEKLRMEVIETLGRIRARGDDDFIASDLDSMPYLVAVGKEILRVHPVAIEIPRVPKKDDVLPLSKPLVGVSGKVYNELPVPAGTATFISTVGYNLNKDVWGPDAYEFRPERWLDISKRPETPLGVYSNLATFSGGPRSCLGWRFAVVELHTFLVTIIRQFDLSLPDNGQEVKSIRPSMLTAVVVGEEQEGPQLPLKVTALKSE